MIGDDVRTGIIGAKKAELAALLVGSGRFKHKDLQNHHVSSDHFISNIDKLREWVQLREESL